MSWLADERAQVAATRILDAVGDLVATEGLAGLGMTQVAAAAGCSRATLYRYYPDRRALLLAFVQREGIALAGRVNTRRGPAHAVLSALDLVRADPRLSAWFAPEVAATSADVALTTEAITAVVGTLVPDEDDARWLVRAIVSLLTTPEPSRAAERRLVERYVVAGLGSSLMRYAKA